AVAGQKENRCALADRVGAHGFWNALAYRSELLKKDGVSDPCLDLGTLANLIKPEAATAFTRLDFPQACAALSSPTRAAGMPPRISGEAIYLHATHGVPCATWHRPTPTKTWAGKIAANMDEGERVYKDIEHLISTDSTMALVSTKGKSALSSALKEQLTMHSHGCQTSVRGGETLDDIKVSLRSMRRATACPTRCRVIAWNGNELCDHRDNRRRVKGARRGDNPLQYDELERQALSMMDDVVDEQAHIAETTGAMLVILVMGDGQSWRHPRGSAGRRIWDALASRILARGQNRINIYQKAGQNPKMLILRGSGLYHKGQHPTGDDWHFLPGGENHTYAATRAKYIMDAATICHELCRPTFDIKAPQSEIIVHDHQTVHYELMLISRDREVDLKEFHLTEQFYENEKWMASEYLAPRRLHTTNLENVSCAALFDWRTAPLSEHESYSVLEILFLLPDPVHDRIRRGQWETYSHASDIRKLHAFLNAGAFLPPKEKWNMRVKTDQKAKDRGYAEGVYALRDTEYLHMNQQQYSHATELRDDGSLVTMVDYKALVDPAPDLEEGNPKWRIAQAIDEAMRQEAPRSAHAQAMVRRAARAEFHSQRQDKIQAEPGEISGGTHIEFLRVKDWQYGELYASGLITDQFDQPIHIAHGFQDIMTPLSQAGLPGERPPLRSMKMDMSMPRVSDLDWQDFPSQKKEEEITRKPEEPAADHVPGSVEPEGPKRSKSVIRRGGRELMLAEAAGDWRERQSGGRRSGWGNIGHAGFDRSFTANSRVRFEFPDGMPNDQQPDPRDGAPEYQPPPSPDEAFVSIRRKYVRASPAAALAQQERQYEKWWREEIMNNLDSESGSEIDEEDGSDRDEEDESMGIAGSCEVSNADDSQEEVKEKSSDGAGHAGTPLIQIDPETKSYDEMQGSPFDIEYFLFEGTLPLPKKQQISAGKFRRLHEESECQLDLEELNLEHEELTYIGFLPNERRRILLATDGFIRENLKAISPPRARYVDELHNNGPVLPRQRAGRTITSDRLSVYADCVADPLLEHLRRLSPNERGRVESYLRARYNTIESASLPGPDHDLAPIYPHLRSRLYASASELGRDEALRLGGLVIHLLRHSTAHVLSSGEWVDVDVLIRTLKHVGYDRAWSRFLHARSMLDSKDIQILGVEMDAAAEGPTSRPMDWDDSFAEIALKGVGATDTADDPNAALGDSDGEQMFMVPAVRPLLVHSVHGDSLRVISPYRRNARHDPNMSDKHGALLLPMDSTDVRQIQCGEVALLLDAAAGLRQYGTVAFTVALSPHAKMIHDLNAVEVTYFATLSPRHVEAHPHWVLPSGQIFTDRIPQRKDIWQIFAVLEAPDDKFMRHVDYDRRLTMLQVAPTPHTGCVDYLEPGQRIVNHVSEDRLNAVSWQGVKETPTWDDDMRLVCHLGHKTLYGMLACGACQEEPPYEALQKQPKRLQPAVDWRHVGMQKVREGKRYKLARRWLRYQEYRGQRPTGYRATCPSWKLWAYLSRYVDLTDKNTDMGILNIFDWDIADPDAREKFEPGAGWDAWSTDNRDDLPTDLWDLWSQIEDELDTHWPPKEDLADYEEEDRDDEDNAPRDQVHTSASVWPSAAAHGKRGRSRSCTMQSQTGDASRAFGGNAMRKSDKSRAPERNAHNPADLLRLGRIRELRFDPPDFCVYDPDSPSQKAKWMSGQVYRVAIELTKDFAWTDINPEIADEDAMRTHLAEVGRYRASLVSGIHLLNARRDMLDLAHRDLHLDREDALPISIDAHKIEARMQYLQQAEARALRHGIRMTPDTFQHAAVERWPQHVHEAAAHALTIWGQHAAETGKGKRARAVAEDRTAPPPLAKARPCRYTDVREPGAGKGDRGKGGRDSWGDRRGDGWDWPLRRGNGWDWYTHHKPMATW
ncbi:unnamed protein product, partial [Prorocentrum cordatum]